jgi:hypothetical protein
MFNIIMIIVNALSLLVALTAHYGGWVYAITFICSLAAMLLLIFHDKIEFLENYEHTPVITNYSLVGAGVLNILAALFSLREIIMMGIYFITTPLVMPLYFVMTLAPFANIYYFYFCYTHSDWR